MNDNSCSRILEDGHGSMEMDMEQGPVLVPGRPMRAMELLEDP